MTKRKTRVPMVARLCDRFDRRIVDQRPKTIIRLRVNRGDHYSARTSREQHFVDIADQAIGLGVVDRGAVSEVRVLVGRTDHDPTVVTPHQVGPDDDTGVVVLETLCGVDTSDLVEPSGVCGPQGRRRSSADGAISLEVPRTRPSAYLHIAHERAARPRVTPRPAVAGCNAPAVLIRDPRRQ